MRSPSKVRERRTFSREKQMLRDFALSKPDLQKMFKEVLQRRKMI